MAANADRNAWAIEGRPFQTNGQSPFGGHGYGNWWDRSDALRQMTDLGIMYPSLRAWEIGYMEQADECEVAQ